MGHRLIAIGRRRACHVDLARDDADQAERDRGRGVAEAGSVGVAERATDGRDLPEQGVAGLVEEH